MSIGPGLRDLKADGPAVRPYLISLMVGRDRWARRRRSDTFRNYTLPELRGENRLDISSPGWV